MYFSVWLFTLFAISMSSFWNVPFVFGAAHLNRSVRIHKRSLDTWVSVGRNGNWPCSRAQIAAIESAVEYTKILANGAIVALDDSGRSSSAYLRWFGHGNAYESDLKAIKEHHYGAVISELRAPESGTVDSVEEGGADPERLVYACPAAGSNLCASGEAAAVINAGDSGFRVNLLYLCPSFFNKVSHSRMLSNWRRGTYTSSAGLVLLHEMQHLDAVVGSERRCVDHAYSVSGCEDLDDEEKITNAQNFAFFALDVTASPPR
ncbi:protease [Colletotrichum higginsianum IMI 349063]|uniref:Protease n=1 Tax=Colletotrichum higginsianum (strain IMI 349063) TaxID=759273 RepID=A0A1B7XQU0_COLHI|nr:protease [Colletotrichum higginsianum IMI 349063]OBR02094.1 protease [Colletotrichum higginsianum IMI 349063]